MSLFFIKKNVVLFLLATTIFFPAILCAQVAKENKNIWDSLLLKLKNKALTDTGYLKQVDSLVTSSPVIVGDKMLKTKLSIYKEIAFDNVKLHNYRVNYYDYLSDNAYGNNLAGVCIYYAEKKEEELKKVKPYVNSLSLLRRQYSIYARIRGGDKFAGTKSYNEHLHFLEWLPEGIKKDSVPVITIRNAFLVLQAQANIFAFQKDSTNTTKVRLLADRIFDAVKIKFSKDIDLIERITAYYYIICEFEMRARLNYAASIAFVMKAKQITATATNGKIQSWKIGFQNNTLIHLVDNYLEFKKIDSAYKYLDSLKAFETNVVPGVRDQLNVLNFTSRLLALKGDYKAAYEANEKSLEVKDSVFAVRTVDINNNMYAQTVAENTKEELDKTESQKRKLYISIACILLLLIGSVSILLSKIYKKEKEMKKRINDLNTASEIQVAELEEQNRIAKLEEQQRLGMELHDDLAGDAAYLKLKIDAEAINSTDSNSQQRLKDLSKHASILYEKARGKSHDWFNHPDYEPESFFKKRIQMLLDNGLDNEKYKKVITIDDEALKDVSVKTKIEILYIIQEAITNIIKHAKAHKVAILIYQDLPGLVLQIEDDGIGFDTKNNNKKTGIGISSIKRRVTALNGLIGIQSGQKGTTISITIPHSTN